MRNGSHRFWLCITAAVAVSVIAVPAASAGVHKHDTELTIGREAGPFFHGFVKSQVRKCERGRQVILFKKRPGADRKLGTARIHRHNLDRGDWGLHLDHQPNGRVYAKVTPKVRDRYVCRADRSPTISG
jgi:hypothetical protein